MTKLRSRRVAIAGITAAVMLGVVMLVVPTITANNAAVVIGPAGTCTYIDPFGTEPTDLDYPFAVTEDTRIVITQSSNGTLNYKCEDITINTGPALTYDAFDNPVQLALQCRIPIGDSYIQTLDWHQTISSSGNVTLTCRFNGF